VHGLIGDIIYNLQKPEKALHMLPDYMAGRLLAGYFKSLLTIYSPARI
jgi:hypothetical protein